MSIPAINAMLQNSKTTGAERAIMWALANRADEHGECWPSLATIANDSGTSRRNVSRCLRHLVVIGELTFIPGTRTTSNLYRLPLDGRDKASPPLGTRRHYGRDKASREVGTPRHGGRDTTSHEPILNQKYKSKPNPKAFGGGVVSPVHPSEVRRL